MSNAAGHRSRPAPDRVGPLSRVQRRRLVTFAILRSLLTAAVLVAIYFTVPLELVIDAMSAAVLVAGLLAVAAVLGFQIRATIRSPYPGLRAVESLAASAPLILLLFALAHYLVDMTYVGSYSEAMTRLDALYFSVTMFATVGFGDIAPVTDLARVITVLQMVGNLIFIGVVARVLFGAALGGRPKRDDPPSR